MPTNRPVLLKHVLHAACLFFPLFTGCNSKKSDEPAIQELGLGGITNEIDRTNIENKLNTPKKNDSGSDSNKSFASNIPAYRKPTRWIKTSELPLASWEVQYLGNEPIGFVSQNITSSSTTASSVIRIESNSEVRFKGKQTVHQKLKIATVEELDGRVKSIEMQLQRGESKLSVEGNLVMGMMRFNIVKDGQASTRQVPWSPEYGGPFAVQQSLRGTPMQEGESRKISVLDPMIADVVDVTLESGKFVNTPLINGTQSRLLEIRTISETENTRTEGLIWADESGIILKTYIGSVDIRSYQSNASLAESIRDSFELQNTSVPTIALERSISLDLQSEKMMYIIKNDSQDPFSTIPSTDHQRMRSRDAFSSELTVFREFESNQNSNSAEEEKLDSSYSSTSPIIQTDDELVIRIATAAIKDPSLGPTIPEQLHNGVFKYIHKKLAFSNYVPSAAEVARLREADSTGHAILLAACARVNSIPSRVAFGVAYNHLTDKPAFEFRSWTELYLNGHWTGMDAYRSEPFTDFTYIKFLDAPLADSNVYRFILKGFKLISETRIEVPDKQ